MAFRMAPAAALRNQGGACRRNTLLTTSGGILHPTNGFWLRIEPASPNRGRFGVLGR
jgi:hypothetical protein